MPLVIEVNVSPPRVWGVSVRPSWDGVTGMSSPVSHERKADTGATAERTSWNEAFVKRCTSAKGETVARYDRAFWLASAAVDVTVAESNLTARAICATIVAVDVTRADRWMAGILFITELDVTDAVSTRPGTKTCDSNARGLAFEKIGGSEIDEPVMRVNT
jgi:hypothetical protein